mgnify:FL=1
MEAVKHVSSSPRLLSHPIIVKVLGKQGAWSCLWDVRYVAKATRPAAPALVDGPLGANSGSGPWFRWPGGANAPEGAFIPKTRDAGGFSDPIR